MHNLCTKPLTNVRLSGCVQESCMKLFWDGIHNWKPYPFFHILRYIMWTVFMAVNFMMCIVTFSWILLQWFHSIHSSPDYSCAWQETQDTVHCFSGAEESVSALIAIKTTKHELKLIIEPLDRQIGITSDQKQAKHARKSTRWEAVIQLKRRFLQIDVDLVVLPDFISSLKKGKPAAGDVSSSKSDITHEKSHWHGTDGKEPLGTQLESPSERSSSDSNINTGLGEITNNQAGLKETRELTQASITNDQSARGIWQVVHTCVSIGKSEGNKWPACREKIRCLLLNAAGKFSHNHLAIFAGAFGLLLGIFLGRGRLRGHEESSLAQNRQSEMCEQSWQRSLGAFPHQTHHGSGLSKEKNWRENAPEEEAQDIDVVFSPEDSISERQLQSTVRGSTERGKFSLKARELSELKLGNQDEHTVLDSAYLSQHSKDQRTQSCSYHSM